MTVEKKQQRAAIYARVSSQEQAAEGVSIEAQIAALKAYAKSQEWEVADEYIDGGFSGGTDDRPALKRLLIDANRGYFNIIAVCKLDRFFRNLRLLLNHLHTMEQIGIKFVSTQEGLDTSTPYGKFAVQIMGVNAEFERGRIGERVKDSRRYLIGRGNWPGGRPPYGYRWLADKRRWEVVTGEAEIVRRIYDLYIRKNLGIEAIAGALNKDGVTTRNGARWRFGSVRQILTHPAYKGRHQIDIPMLSIIDESTWQQAQQRRESARSILVNPKGWLLQGMCYCGKCGHVLKYIRKRTEAHGYYACRGRVNRKSYSKEGRCDLPYVRADRLEQEVWEKVKEVLNNSDQITECINRSVAELEKRRKEVGARSLDIERRLGVVRARTERLGMAFADGAIGESTYKSKLKLLKKEEIALMKSSRDFDLVELAEVISLGVQIDMVKEVLSKGILFGGDPNISREMKVDETGGESNSIEAKISEFISCKLSEDDTLIDGLTDVILKDMIIPSGICVKDDYREKQEEIIRHRRAILQLFNIKVIVYPERIEIKGTIPSQVLEITAKKELKTAPIISSPYLPGGGWQTSVRAACN